MKEMILTSFDCDCEGDCEGDCDWIIEIGSPISPISGWVDELVILSLLTLLFL